MLYINILTKHISYNCFTSYTSVPTLVHIRVLLLYLEMCRGRLNSSFLVYCYRDETYGQIA